MAEPRKPDIKKSILNRVRMLYILFFAVGVALAGKYYISNTDPAAKACAARASGSPTNGWP